MNAADFDRRVQQHLDARRDPLDDAELCAFLADHPDRLPTFGRLCETLRWLPAAHPRPARRRRWPFAVATGAVAAAALLLAIGWAPPEPTPPKSRILRADLYEIQPRAFAAVHYAVRQPLLVDATTTLETYENRSERR